jgi:hypothetical protein
MPQPPRQRRNLPPMMRVMGDQVREERSRIRLETLHLSALQRPRQERRQHRMTVPQRLNHARRRGSFVQLLRQLRHTHRLQPQQPDIVDMRRDLRDGPPLSLRRRREPGLCGNVLKQVSINPIVRRQRRHQRGTKVKRRKRRFCHSRIIAQLAARLS